MQEKQSVCRMQDCVVGTVLYWHLEMVGVSKTKLLKKNKEVIKEELKPPPTIVLQHLNIFNKLQIGTWKISVKHTERRWE